MEEIKNVIKSVIENMASKKQDHTKRIEEIFVHSIKNKKVLEHMRILGYKEGVLNIIVDSPAWLYQCHLQKSHVLKSIQEKIPEIKKIYFKVGKV